MSSFLLDADGDLNVSDASEVTLTTGLQAIQQHLQVKLRMFKGEWFLNTEVGVPWFQDILVKQPNFVIIENTLKTEILETAGVLSLVTFDFDFNSSTRLFELDFKALTEEGIVDFSQEIEA